MPDRVRSQFGNFFTNITTPAKHRGIAKAIKFPFKSPTYKEFKNIITIVNIKLNLIVKKKKKKMTKT